ncbi:MAG TPA: cation diffusion facilitator family transporter [Caulobacteraceae bacterium]|nr:cation diffusion facilitator family transporter [Caulobacteraceae bacterium]
MASGTGTVVLAAMAGNLSIAVVKFAAFLFTRSTAMLTEAIHSCVDTIDQLLLLIGQGRAVKAPDERHPFGYGMETYFWGFVVALMIFFAGGTVSIWQGLDKLRHPTPIDRPWINYLVLAFSAVFEGSSFAVAYREFRRTVAGRRVRLWNFLQASKDPSLFSTLMEDGAALTGLALAALGVTGSGYLGLPWADGAASIAIGALLLGVALFLANETRSLIAGEAAHPFVLERIRAVLARDEQVVGVRRLDTLHLGPECILVAVEVRFVAGLDGQALLAAVKDLEARIGEADRRITPVYVSPCTGEEPPGGPAPATPPIS